MRRSRKWILGCVVVVVILAVALGVGLGVGLKRCVSCLFLYLRSGVWAVLMSLYWKHVTFMPAQ